MGKWLLTAGIALAIVTAVLLNLRIAEIESAQASQPFLKLKPTVTKTVGDALELTNLEVIRLPESASALAKLAIPNDEASRQWIKGRRVTRDIPAGELLQYEHFADEPEQRFPMQIEQGKRAMTITVGAASAVGYFVEPGSRVDLVGTLLVMNRDLSEDVARREPPTPRELSNQITSQLVTKTILQNVRVLAVDRATTRSGYLNSAERGYRTITVELTPQESEKLIFALNQLQDNLTVLLRNPGDDQISDIPAVSFEDL